MSGKKQLSGKQALLRWCQNTVEEYPTVTITNFTTSWSSGLAFCAILHKHRPSLIPFSSLSASDPERNHALAFKVAEELGIPALLDVEDMMIAKPEPRSVMTYLSQYYHYFRTGSSRGTGHGIASIKQNPSSASTSSSSSSSQRQSSAPAAQRCAACSKPVSGSVCQFEQQQYHASCFRCSKCRKALRGRCLNVGNKPYCEQCGRSAFVTQRSGGSGAGKTQSEAEMLREKRAAMEKRLAERRAGNTSSASTSSSSVAAAAERERQVEESRKRRDRERREREEAERKHEEERARRAKREEEERKRREKDRKQREEEERRKRDQEERQRQREKEAEEQRRRRRQEEEQQQRKDREKREAERRKRDEERRQARERKEKEAEAERRRDEERREKRRKEREEEERKRKAEEKSKAERRRREEESEKQRRASASKSNAAASDGGTADGLLEFQRRAAEKKKRISQVHGTSSPGGLSRASSAGERSTSSSVEKSAEKKTAAARLSMFVDRASASSPSFSSASSTKKSTTPSTKEKSTSPTKPSPSKSPSKSPSTSASKSTPSSSSGGGSALLEFQRKAAEKKNRLSSSAPKITISPATKQPERGVKSSALTAKPSSSANATTPEPMTSKKQLSRASSAGERSTTSKKSAPLSRGSAVVDRSDQQVPSRMRRFTSAQPESPERASTRTTATQQRQKEEEGPAEFQVLAAKKKQQLALKEAEQLSRSSPTISLRKADDSKRPSSPKSPQPSSPKSPSSSSSSSLSSSKSGSGSGKKKKSRKGSLLRRGSSRRSGSTGSFLSRLSGRKTASSDRLSVIANNNNNNDNSEDTGASPEFSPFGASLTELRDAAPAESVPAVWERLVQLLRENKGHKSADAFRKSGDVEEVSRLVSQFARKPAAQVRYSGPPEVVADCIKLWLSELAEPVVPRQEQQACRKLAPASNQDITSASVAPLTQALQRFPDANYNVFVSVLALCHEVLQHSAKNQHTPGSLSSSFSTHLFQTDPSNAAVFAAHCISESRFVEALLRGGPRDAALAPRVAEPPKPHRAAPPLPGDLKEVEISHYIVESKTLEGYLEKENPRGMGASKKWKRRWFSYHDGRLLYYKHSAKGAKRTDDLLGFIELAEARVVPLDDYKGSAFCISIATPTRVYLLRAQEEAEKEYWAKALLAKQGELAQVQKERVAQVQKFFGNQDAWLPISSKAGVFEGQLERLGMLKVWVKRWVVMRDGMVFWFKRAYDSKPEGKIYLYESNLEEYDADEHDGCAFRIKQSKGDSLVLRTSSPEEMAKWTNAILRQRLLMEEQINGITL